MDTWRVVVTIHTLQVGNYSCASVKCVTGRVNDVCNNSCTVILILVCIGRPPLWSSGQSFWLQIQRSRVRFPALPDFLSSSGSGTGSNQSREVN